MTHQVSKWQLRQDLGRTATLVFRFRKALLLQRLVRWGVCLCVDSPSGFYLLHPEMGTPLTVSRNTIGVSCHHNRDR